MTSAGATSPIRNRTTSPGTRAAESTSCHCPSRRARAFWAKAPFSAASALEASCSSQKPSTALKTNRAVMMAKSPKSLTASARIAAASIIPGIGPQKKPRNTPHWLLFLSSRALGPYCPRRFLASSEVNPRSELPSCLNRSPIAILCGSEDDGPGATAAGVCIFIFAGDCCLPRCRWMAVHCILPASPKAAVCCASPIWAGQEMPRLCRRRLASNCRIPAISWQFSG